MNVLYVNHAVKACGVYQIGLRIAGFLSPSTRYRVVYQEVSSAEQLIAAINETQSPVVIYNFFTATLPFINPELTTQLRRAGITQYAIIHDPMDAAFMQFVEATFDYWIVHDPTNPIPSFKKFTTCRPVPRFAPAPPPEKISFGSHGFGISPWKAFDFIVAVVNNEYDEAIINFNIGLAAFGDRDGTVAVQWRELCQKQITKPGIQLNITHDFLETEEDMIRFLQKNTVNLYFVRDPPGYAGPAGSADLAIASQRALVVNNGYMYRHLFTQIGAYGINGNLQSLCQNEKKVGQLYRDWSPERVRADYERMLDLTQNRG